MVVSFSSFLLPAIIAVLLQAVLHLAVQLYTPRLGLLPRYILGTLAYSVPISAQLWAWNDIHAVILLWVSLTGSGLIVCAGYLIRWIRHLVVRNRELSQQLELLENASSAQAARPIETQH